MITARNYAAQAEKALLNSKQVEKEMSESMIDLIKNSIKFAAPDGGYILDDELKGLLGKPVNIPFKSITLEFFVPYEMHSLENQQDHMFMTKRLAIAFKEKETINVFTAGYFPKMNEWIFPKCVFHVKENSICKEDGIEYDVSQPEYLTKERCKLEENIAKSIMFSLFELCEALSCKNVYTQSLEVIDEKKNERRIKTGKLPLYETKILVIDTKPKEIDATWKGGTHASPRQHLRRGHIRRYSWGNIWINNCIVGKAENGKIDKSYAVK